MNLKHFTTSALFLATTLSSSTVLAQEVSTVTPTPYSRVQEVLDATHQVLDSERNDQPNDQMLSVGLEELEVQNKPGLSSKNLNQVSDKINSKLDRKRQRWELEVDWENSKLKSYL